MSGKKSGKKGSAKYSPTAFVAGGMLKLWNSDFEGALAEFMHGDTDPKKKKEGHRDPHPRQYLHAADVDGLISWITGSSSRRQQQMEQLSRTDKALEPFQKRAATEAGAVAIAEEYWLIKKSRSSSSKSKKSDGGKQAAQDSTTQDADAGSAAADSSQGAVEAGDDSGFFISELPRNPSASLIAANVKLDLDVISASMHLFKAMNLIQQTERLKALYHLRKSWKMFEKLAKQVDLGGAKSSTYDQGLVDCVKFGVGLFYFLISFVPGAVAKVVEAIGFKGDRQRGISLLQQVSDNNTISAPFASLMLLLNYLMIPRAFSDTSDFIASAGTLLDQENERYPNCPSFNWLRSHYHRKCGDVSDAIESLTVAIAMVDETLGLPAHNFMFDLGCCHFMQRNWEKAAEVFEALTDDEVKEFDLKGMSNLQLACCYHMQGREDDAFERLRKMPALASAKSRFDKVAASKAKRCCAQKRINPFLGYEMLYLRRDLAHLNKDDLGPLVADLDEMAKENGIIADGDDLGDDSDKSDSDADGTLDALGVGADKKERKKVQSLEKQNWTGDKAALRGTYHLIRGAAMIGMGKTSAAAKSFSIVISLEKAIEDEKYLLPYSMYELAELRFRAGEISEAEALLQRSKKFGGYDWEEVLSNRIRMALQQIDDEKKGKKKK